MKIPIEKFLIPPGSTIGEAAACIDRNAQGIALIVDEDRRLIGTVTDGDIRRAILRGLDLGHSVARLQEVRSTHLYPKPITLPFDTPDEVLRKTMSERSIRHIPLVDVQGRVVDVALLSQLVKERSLPINAVIMAGGYGTRLLPLTQDVPKPMLQVGDKPLLEHTIQQLREAGIRKVNLTTHYRGEQIAEHFGDGRGFGVEISYVEENQPLGTAGALGVLKESAEPLLVMNGDILTKVNFRAMLDFHHDHRADMTVAVRQYEMHVPFGVVEADGIHVSGIVEKPTLRHFVSAGIYLLAPQVCRSLPDGVRFDMPDLIRKLVGEGRCVVSFPVREYWLDIGRLEDYELAQDDARKGEFDRP